MISKKRLQIGVVCAFAILVSAVYGADDSLEDLRTALNEIETRNDILAVIGSPAQPVRSVLSEFVVDRDMIVYVQVSDPDELLALRELADRRMAFGSRIFVEEAKPSSISLADNLAGVVFVCGSVRNGVSEQELLRVAYPGATILVGGRKIVKPHVTGTDSWSHPHHGPDNNPQSTDQRARAPYLTQFLAEPLFCPMPEVSVAAGGKVFRAFGHIAHKANQNEMLNTLICANAYNGTILWQRPLKEGFMIHRNTMIATPEILYMADDESCKLIDTQT
ncbi:MAG: hypothetical protein JSW59_02085, partial [Phycisphaerales bacterium]